MKSWAPIWSTIVDSSIWCEPDYVVKVFLTMMALKDADHICRLTAFNLAQRAHKTEAEVLEALRILASPDTKRIEPQEFEGRRIQAVEEGWLVLNGEKYRDLVRAEMKRARNRRAQAAWRDRHKKTANDERERRFVAAYEEGDDAKADRIAAEGLASGNGEEVS